MVFAAVGGMLAPRQEGFVMMAFFGSIVVYECIAAICNRLERIHDAIASSSANSSSRG